MPFSRIAYNNSYNTYVKRRPQRKMTAAGRVQFRRLSAGVKGYSKRSFKNGSIAGGLGYIRNLTTKDVHIEKKSLDGNNANYVVNAAGTITLLNGCIAGSQMYNRTGRKIHLKSLQMRGALFPAGNVTFTDVRIIIFYDKQTNGAAPAVVDVINSVNQAGVASSTVLDGLNLNNRDRFQIIRDKHYTMGISTTLAGSAQSDTSVYTVDDYIKLDCETVYNAGAAGTVGDITTGGLFMLLIGDTTGQYAVDMGFRTRFTDV